MSIPLRPIAVTTFLFAIVALSLGLQAREEGPELLFYASFDKLHANADFARGDGESTLKENLELRIVRGIKDVALRLEKGERCSYSVKGNLHMDAASVSFWIKPFNWESSGKHYVAFFSTRDSNAPFRMDIRHQGGKNGGDQIRMAFTWGSRRDKARFREIALLAPQEFEKDRWYKIDATWDSEAARLYVNGKQVAKTTYQDVDFPDLQDDRFSIVPIWPEGMSDYHVPTDRTVIDEVKIFKGVRTADVVRRDYLADRGMNEDDVPHPVVRVPLVKKAPAIDGKLDEAVWSRAAKIPVRVKPDAFSHNHRTWALLAYTDKGVLVGFENELEPGRKVVAIERPRDGSPHKDDSVEIYFWPVDDIRDVRDRYQFLINAVGSFMDIYSTREWNGRFDLATDRGDDRWTVEAFFPFETLRKDTPKPGEKWRANFCRNWWRPNPPHRTPQFTAWDGRAKGYIEGQGYMVFGGDDRAARVTLSTGLSMGALKLTAETPSARPLTLKVTATGSGTEPFEKSVTFSADNPATIDETLTTFKDGILTVAASDPADGAEVYRHTMRFYVKDPLAVNLVPDVPNDRALLKIDMSNLDPARLQAVRDGKATLHVTVDDADGRRGEKTFEVTSVSDTYALPLTWGTRPSAFRFVFDLKVPGAETLRRTQTANKPATPWIEDKAGVSDEILYPFTPIVYENGMVGVWGRHYDLNGVFPQKIANQGRDILRGPIAMTLVSGGKTETLSGQNPSGKTRKASHRYDYGGSTEIAGGEAAWSNFFEYDGLAVTKLTLTPPKGGWTIDRLTMTIPLRGDLVKFIRKPKRQEWNGARWTADFEPYVWVGTEDEGFCWFFDSGANWIADPQTPATVIEVDGDEATVRLTIVPKTVKVDQPMAFVMGFQASPVKPPIAGWRNFNNHSTTPLRRQNNHSFGTNHRKHFAFFEPDNADAARAFHEERRRLGIREMMYMGVQIVAPTESQQFFDALWRNPYKSDSRHTMSVCHGSSFTDYILYEVREHLKRFDLNSVYTDVDRLIPCDNALHGCGTVDAFGRRVATYHILERRDFYKRLVTICRNLDSVYNPGLYHCHCHDNLVLPYHAWADLFYPGEQYSHAMYKKPWFYMEEHDPMAWRCELRGKAFGIPHVFLPQFKRGTGSEEHVQVPQYTQSLIGITLVNDIVVCGSWNHDASIEDLWEIKARTGLNRDDAEFVAFWRENCPVGTDDKARASVYIVRPDRACVVVQNAAKDDRSVVVTVDLNALGIDPARAKAKDERTGNELEIENGKFTVPVKGYNYTVVSLTPLVKD